MSEEDKPEALNKESWRGLFMDCFSKGQLQEMYNLVVEAMERRDPGYLRRQEWERRQRQNHAPHI